MQCWRSNVYCAYGAWFAKPPTGQMPTLSLDQPATFTAYALVMAQVANFEQALNALLDSKNTSISASKIKNLTSLAISNVKVHSCVVNKTRLIRQNNSEVITVLFKFFKSCPPDYKLSVLYVVDSISRAARDEHKKKEKPGEVGDGTYGEYLTKVSAILEALVDDMMAVAAEDHKVRRRRTGLQSKRSQLFKCRAGTVEPLLSTV